MGHYDNCRDGYCARCGAAPGNIKDGVCEFCGPRTKPAAMKVAKVKKPTKTEYEAAMKVVAAYQKRKQ
jgi:ribosomal protein L37E